MKVAIVLCLFAVLALTQAFSFMEHFNDIVNHRHEKAGTCKTFCHAAFCKGEVNDYAVSVLLLVDEFEKDEKETMILGKFFVGGNMIEKEFPVDKVEDFCETVKGKEYCFELKVTQPKCCKPHLHGTVALTKPVKMSLGSFRLPLMHTHLDDVSDEMTFEEVDADRLQ